MISDATVQHRKQHDLCVLCGKPNEAGKSLCKKHLMGSKLRTRDWRRKNKQRRREAGLCVSCDSPRDHDSDFCFVCTAKRTEKMRLTRQNRDPNLCHTCGRTPPVDGAKRCQVCIDKFKKWYSTSDLRDRYTKQRELHRQTVIAHYGEKCSCCGESIPQFLAIDHINGNGNKERKKIKKAGSGFYKWLIDNNFPEGYQVLCHNCNMGRHLNGGICPHKQSTLPSID